MNDAAANAEFLDSLSFNHRIIYRRSIKDMILVEIVLMDRTVSFVVVLDALEI